MSLVGLDLNLLVALHALLEERNVTRAGQRIGLSQPATSAALGRLRRHFGDDLLVRVGNGYELTPLGVALRAPASNAWAVLERLFTSRADFDPRSEERRFTLLASDYAVMVFGARLSHVLHSEAPHVRLDFRPVSPTLTENTDAVLSGVDGVLMPHGVISGFPTVELYYDEWVCLVADDHPDVSDAITLPDMAALPWAVYQRAFDAPVTRQLSMMGLEPRVEVSVQDFHLLPEVVTGTRRIAIIQRRLVQLLHGRVPVRVLTLPFNAVPLQEAMWWHPVHTHDAAHTWLRETAARVAATLPGAAQV